MQLVAMRVLVLAAVIAASTSPSAAQYKSFSATRPRSADDGPRIVLSYAPASGMCNQLFNLLHMLVVAYATKSDLQLQIPWSRRDLNSVFDNQLWFPVNNRTFLDIQHLHSYSRARGTNITFPTYELPAGAQGLAWRHVKHILPADSPDVAKAVTVSLPEPGHSLSHFQRAVERVRSESIAAGLGKGQVVRLHLDHFPIFNPITPAFDELMQRVYIEAARAIRFAPALRHHASQIVKGLIKAGGRYDGLHLRVEVDAIYYWRGSCSGLAACTSRWYQSTVQNFFTRRSMYVASGIFMRSNGGEYLLGEDQVGMVVALLANTTRKTRVFHSGMFLPSNITSQLNAEEMAAIDFLVLAHADRFAGVSSSTFSEWVSQWRVMFLKKKHADNRFVNVDLTEEFYRETNDGHWFAAKIPTGYSAAFA